LFAQARRCQAEASLHVIANSDRRFVFRRERFECADFSRIRKEIEG